MTVTIHAEGTKEGQHAKKLALFNSGMVPLERYKRDMHLIDRLKPQSLRIDLYMGDRDMEFGALVDGTAEHPAYHFERFDALLDLLKAHDVAPYISWCYNPLPLQPENGDFRSYPVSEGKYCEIMRTLSAHLKQKMGGALYYEEIYNEPDCEDVFFEGSYEQFLRLYALGCKAIREAGSTGLIGGPAEAFVLSPECVEKNIGAFLQFVEAKNLPLDFFSFHSYGYENKEYLTRTQQVLALLKQYRSGRPVQLHINELNVVPAPWTIGGTMLETTAMLPAVFTMLAELVNVPEITLVHWAQFLASGIDALGLVDVTGKLMPAFFAFEIFARMPACPLAVSAEDSVGCMASMDEKRLSAVFWNKTGQPLRFDARLADCPRRFGAADVFLLNEAFFAALDRCPQQPLEAAKTGSIPAAGEMSFALKPYDLVYLESNRT